MKHFKKALSTAIIVAATAQPVSATLIADGYWGDPGTTASSSWGDRIGNHTTSGGGYTFETHSMDVTFDANTDFLTVQINTNYAGHTGLWGTGYGDLFLSSAWTPDPDGTSTNNYNTDNHSNGTLWSYGLAIEENRFQSGITGGVVSLYELNGSNLENAILSDEVTSGGFRNGQEVIVDKDSDTTADTGIDGRWLVNDDNANDYVSFMIDLTGTGLLADITRSGSLGLHWNMTCGNDTIEGEYGVTTRTNVPEPAMLGLLAIGLVGFGVSRRKKT